MTTATNSNGNDSVLEALVTLLHFQGVAADREQIRHRFNQQDRGIGYFPVRQILRIEGAGVPDEMAAACQNAIAGDRKPAGRPVHGGCQSQ